MNLGKLGSSLLAMACAAVTSQAEISFNPITDNATTSAQKLYNFLAVHYGTHTVSGVQTGDLPESSTLTELPDLQAVYDAAGKYPALVGFDFLFANGVKASDAWYQAYTNKSIELAEALWNEGGIPAFSWHWKDPSHSVDAFYTKGSGDPYTDFNFTQAFESGTTNWNTSSATYTQLIEDIDEISALFKKLQDKGVAAIFRPLHEAGGTWFWWSTQTGAQYAALYQLVYTRMTQTNGIKNLVWVWNPQESIFNQTSWNPGSQYYDIIGVDIYNNAYDYQSNSNAFHAMTTQFGTNKILTLSENGPIPDASLMHQDNTVWSWYMPWYESWSGKFVSKTKNTVWEANLASTCVFTLDKMPGWSQYSLSTEPAKPCEVGYKLGDLDTTVVKEELLPDTSNGNGWLKVVVDNMHTQVDTKGDTTVPAAANIFIVPSINLSGATTASVTVYNTSLSGIWFSLALLTDGDWKWEQPSDGCWLNGGETKECSFDVSKMSMDKASKIYIMLATEGYSGTLYFDNLTTNKGTIASFDQSSDLFTREQEGAKAYVKTLELVGGGASLSLLNPSVFHTNPLIVRGNTVQFSLAQSGAVSLQVFDLKGQQIATLHQGPLAAGNHSFSLAQLPKGLYFVKGSGALGQVHQKVIIQK